MNKSVEDPFERRGLLETLSDKQRTPPFESTAVKAAAIPEFFSERGRVPLRPFLICHCKTKENGEPVSRLDPIVLH
jgi:hypothetical protein